MRVAKIGGAVGVSTLGLCALAGLLLPTTSCRNRVETKCETCHASPKQEASHRIEEAHPWSDLNCTDCHGGDGRAEEKNKAHVQGPEENQELRTLAADQLDEIPEDYLRFLNPGDLRVAEKGCGSTNPKAGDGGCHQDKVDTVSRSVMSTFVGHYNVPRYLAGLQGHAAEFGSRDIVHEDFNAADAPQGAVEQIAAMRPPPDSAPREDMATLMDHYLVKKCPTCHAYTFGKNDSPGNYRSSGCTSCHMVYERDGLSQSGDPTVDKDFPSHPAKHQLTTAIPEYQCEHCHYQGARIGLLFQGIREGGFEDTPPNAEPWDETQHGHGPGFYFFDEDTTNNVDETPPDLHFSAGMTCVDCHVGSDVHGDGWMYSTAKFQVGVRCEDCHGTVRDAIEEESDGFFHAAAGHPLKQLERKDNGSIVLVGRMDGEEHAVKQITQVLELESNPNMVEAMGVHDGWSHTDSLECYACHTGYRQSCFGCHVEMNDKASMTDHQTGQETKGFVQGGRDFYSIDFYGLGMNDRGKISSICPSMQVFISYFDESGEPVFEERIRTTANGLKGFGWATNNQHTIQRVPQNCDTCHVKPDESNMEEVRHTYGFGTGEFFMPDEDGMMHDLTQILDDQGEPIVEFGHEGAGPVPADVIDRILNDIRVEPQDR
jgi:hypothetical protein